MIEVAKQQKREDRPTVEMWVRAVASEIRKACRGQLYGRIVIEITKGWPTRLLVERSVKDPRAVAMDDEEPLG